MYGFQGPLDVASAVSKRQPTYGASSRVGKRDADLAAELGLPGAVSKALPMGLSPQPVKKAPTLAQTGPKPNKRGLLVQQASGLVDDAARVGGRAVAGGLSKRFYDMATRNEPVGKAAGDAMEAFHTLQKLGASDAMKSSRGLRPKNSQFDVESAKLRTRGVTRLKPRKTGAVPTATPPATSAIGKALRAHHVCNDEECVASHKNGTGKVLRSQGQHQGSQYGVGLSKADRDTKIRAAAGATAVGATGMLAGNRYGRGLATAARSRFKPKARPPRNSSWNPAKEGYAPAKTKNGRTTSWKHADVAKAYRSYAAEDRRQRRLGAASAGAGIGGSLLARSGAKEIIGTTKDARSKVHVARQNGMRENAAQSAHGRAVKEAGSIKVDGAALIHRKPAGKVAGGAALIGAGGAMLRGRHTRRWQ